jgi:hypothetical protein
MDRTTSQVNTYRAARRVIVAEALRQTINDVLQKSGIVAFTTVAPTLVELRSAKVVSSATQEYVKEFILGHESSAIGIAGPRGSGKSTLMRAICDNTSIASHSIFISAPVKYDAIDFTRRLFLEAGRQILGKTGRSGSASKAARRVQRTRFGGSVLGIAAGVVLVLYDVVSARRLPFRPLTTLGLIIILYGAVAFSYRFLNMLRTTRDRVSSPSVQRGRRGGQ